MIRVQIETASAVTRAGLEALLGEQPDFEIVSSASDADVILAEEPSNFVAAAPLVVLTDETTPRDALRSGARAALSRDAAPAQIVAAIYAAAAGLVAVAAEDVAALASQAEQTADPLTPREMEVLEMLSEGLSNKLIAHRLSISEHTAKFHVNSILAKLDSGTRTEAVMRGIRLGLIKI